MRTKTSLQSLGERGNIAVVSTGVDVWRGSGSLIPIPNQTTGESMTIVSTSADDASAGTGIRTVFVHYLDNAWAEASETVTLNGLTPVNLIATNIKFIQSIHAASVGSGGVAAGDITIYKTGDATTVYDLIKAGGNMSLTISMMVPANSEFHLGRWTATASSGNKPVFIRLRSTDHHGVLYDGGSPVFIFKDTCTLEAGGTYIREWSSEQRVVLPAKSIIKVSVWADSAGANVASSLEGELISTT